jgi:hypothetical protein
VTDAEGDTIDVLDAVEARLHALSNALEQAEASTDYLDGQQAFFDAALDAIGETGPEEAPKAVLERAAERVGLHVDGYDVQGTPLSAREAGALAAWGLCLGYADGFPAGARAVVDTVDQVPGVEEASGDR